MAQIRREVSDRTTFGKIVKWVFIGFNILMPVWIVAGLVAAGSAMGGAINEAEQAGAAIGTTIGVGLLVALWALGDIILGILVLLTRRKKLVEIEE